MPEAVDKTKDSVNLSWRVPRHDGKGKIFGYLIEYRKPGAVEWIQANETPESCPDTKFVVTKLPEGGEFEFRIMAVNAAGKSEPANVKEPVKVHDRLGNFFLFIYIFRNCIRVVLKSSYCFIILSPCNLKYVFSHIGK